MSHDFSKKNTAFLLIGLIIIVLFCLFFLFQLQPKSKMQPTSIKNISEFAIIDLFNNKVHFLDNNYNILGHTTIGKREDIGLLDGDFAPNGHFYLLIEGNPSSNNRTSPYIAVINPMNFQVIDKIKTTAPPANISIISSGKAYLTHNFEYSNGSGWAVSVLDINARKIVKEIKIPGAPYKPKIVSDDIYIPVMGGGERHFGNSNIVKINSKDDSSSKLLPDDFTEIPPTDFVIDNNNVIAEFLGEFSSEKTPRFQKGFSNWKHFIAFIPMDDPFKASVVDVNISGSIVRDFIFSSDEKINLSYTLADDQKGQNGLVIIDKAKKKNLEHIKIEDSDWNRNAIEVGGNILVANASQKKIMIFDKSAGKFSHDVSLGFSPNYIIWNRYDF